MFFKGLRYSEGQQVISARHRVVRCHHLSPKPRHGARGYVENGNGRHQTGGMPGEMAPTCVWGRFQPARDFSPLPQSQPEAQSLTHCRVISDRCLEENYRLSNLRPVTGRLAVSRHCARALRSDRWNQLVSGLDRHWAWHNKSYYPAPISHWRIQPVRL